MLPAVGGEEEEEEEAALAGTFSHVALAVGLMPSTG